MPGVAHVRRIILEHEHRAAPLAACAPAVALARRELRRDPHALDHHAVIVRQVVGHDELERRREQRRELACQRDELGGRALPDLRRAERVQERAVARVDGTLQREPDIVDLEQARTGDDSEALRCARLPHRGRTSDEQDGPIGRRAHSAAGFAPTAASCLSSAAETSGP